MPPGVAPRRPSSMPLRRGRRQGGPACTWRSPGRPRSLWRPLFEDDPIMVSLRSLLFIIAVLSCSAVDKDAVFKPGDGGYACFRSPSLTFVDNDNRLLAILEAYKYGCVSRQWCDIVQKVSTDGGASWSNVTLIYGTGGTGGNRSSPCFQNVSPTLDRRTGKLFLPFHAATTATMRPTTRTSRQR